MDMVEKEDMFGRNNGYPTDMNEIDDMLVKFCMMKQLRDKQTDRGNGHGNNDKVHDYFNDQQFLNLKRNMKSFHCFCIGYS